MEKKKRNIKLDDRKIMIVGVVVVILVIVIAIVLARTTVYEDIADDYFVSDETKLALSLKKEESAFEMSEYEPDITRVVYFYSGNTITGMRVFYDYGTESAAKEANEFVMLDNKDWAAHKKLNGKYIIFEVEKSQYNKLTTDEIRRNIGEYQSGSDTTD